MVLSNPTVVQQWQTPRNLYFQIKSIKFDMAHNFRITADGRIFRIGRKRYPSGDLYQVMLFGCFAPPKNTCFSFLKIGRVQNRVNSLMVFEKVEEPWNMPMAIDTLASGWIISFMGSVCSLGHPFNRGKKPSEVADMKEIGSHL
jgi:hypothetical protein